MLITAVGRPDIAPLKMPDRFRLEVVYFMTPGGDRGAPGDLGSREYWIARDDAARFLDDGVVRVVSPLDAASKAEIALSEDHELWLEWLVRNDIQRIRLD